MSDVAERQYGVPQLTIHRAGLLSVLADAFPLEQVQLAKRAVAASQGQDGAVLQFSDGSQAKMDVLIGADGIHSVVRNTLFGKESPRFTGIVAFRAVVLASHVAHVPNIQAFTKWGGPTAHSQIVTFPLNRGEDIFIFATTAQGSWHEESCPPRQRQRTSRQLCRLPSRRPRFAGCLRRGLEKRTL